MGESVSAETDDSTYVSRTFELAKRGLENPTAVPTYLRNVYNKEYMNMKYRIYRKKNKIPRQKRLIHDLINGEEFVLIILDSCRYDVFRELYPEFFSGTLDRVWSSGNWTQKWMERTWDSTYDLTYISTTPYTFDYGHKKNDSQYRPSDRFDEVIDVIDEEWNPVLSTTPPEPVTDIALQYFADVDTPRAVVHYMQPHAPYIGDTRILQWDISEEQIVKLLGRVEGTGEDSGEPAEGSSDTDGGGDGLTVEELVQKDLTYRQERQFSRLNYEPIHTQFKRGKISREELHEAYRDNLKYVLSEVQRLVSYLDCPVVISADHGEHLGNHFDEVPKLTHPDCTHPVLREVPWLVVDEKCKGKNELSSVALHTDRDVTVESETSEETVNNRLKALGYK